MYTRVPPVMESIRASRPCHQLPYPVAVKTPFWLIAAPAPSRPRPQARQTSNQHSGDGCERPVRQPQDAKARASDVPRRVKSLKGGLRARGGGLMPRAPRRRFYDTQAGWRPSLHAARRVCTGYV